MSEDIIKIFIVEDSLVQRQLLIAILDSYKRIKIIGFATNGFEAIRSLEHLTPHVILMDLHMPKLNGIETIKHIMAHHPLPIIAMSASDSKDDIVNGFKALEAGAVAFVEKPSGTQHPRYQLLCDYLIEKIILMSEIKTVKRWSRAVKSHQSIQNTSITQLKNSFVHPIEMIGVGVSTGGPVVLQSILSGLSDDFPPLLIVQHITPGFIEGLSEWLTMTTKHPVVVAKNGDVPQRGCIYMAPDHFQMGVSSQKNIFLNPKKSDAMLCPSVGFLFDTLSVTLKEKSVGILLTGMGTDGAVELKKMKMSGAITIAQNEETSLIYGMPGEAVALGAANYVLSPEEITQLISNFTTQRRHE